MMFRSCMATKISTVTNWHRAVSTIAIMVIDRNHGEPLSEVGARPSDIQALTSECYGYEYEQSQQVED
jgi:hypothetical protein